MKKIAVLMITAALLISCSSSKVMWRRPGKLQWTGDNFRFIPYADWQKVTTLPDTLYRFTAASKKPNY